MLTASQSTRVGSVRPWWIRIAGASSEVQKRPRNREAEFRVFDPDGNAIDLSLHGWPV